jgi:hypothetical protein
MHGRADFLTRLGRLPACPAQPHRAIAGYVSGQP